MPLVLLRLFRKMPLFLGGFYRVIKPAVLAAVEPCLAAPSPQ
jgi:hypothetical protein